MHARTVDVGFGESSEGIARHRDALDAFRLRDFHHARDESLESRPELRPEFRRVDGLEAPEILFLVDGSHEREAIARWEERLDAFPNLVLALHRGTLPRRRPQCLLEVFLRGNLRSVLAKIEVKVAEKPQEGRRERSELCTARCAGEGPGSG